MSAEGDKLWEQLTNLFYKIAYQPSLGSFVDVWRAECVHAPALRLASRDQGSDAHNLMERMFGEPRTECFSDLALGRIAQVEHPGGRRKIGYCFQIPNNY